MPTKAKSGRTGSKEGADGGGRKPNGLQQPLQPSEELAAVVGPGPLPRAEVVRQVWAYIKRHGLQNPENRREVLADAKLEPVFGAKKVTMFAMNKHPARHPK
jgi:upstream activation factor subunit UAF30